MLRFKGMRHRFYPLMGKGQDFGKACDTRNTVVAIFLEIKWDKGSNIVLS